VEEIKMACKYYEDKSGSSKLCNLRERYGSCVNGEDKWVNTDRRHDYCENSWRFRECPDYDKNGHKGV
jgi:hypothetical protein